MNLRIPLARPEITDEDRAAVSAVLQNSALSIGPKLVEFEEAVCSYLDIPYAVAVNSGTSALHLGIRLLQIEPGAEVILPSFTFAALLNVILQEGLKPVFVDIDPISLNVTADLVENAITPQTRAIVTVHTFGRPAPAVELRSIADGHGIALIEDACEALGAECSGKKAGAFGTFAALAFYPNKQITTGEGGMLLTSNGDDAQRARRLRNQGRDPSRDFYQQVEIGYSYRLSEMNCALGLSQLQRIECILQRRASLAAHYDARLSQVPEIIRPPLHSEYGRISWFCYVIQLAPEFSAADRDAICGEMLQRGIGVGRYFAPLHRQPVMANVPQSMLPHTDSVASRVIALPFFHQLTEAETEEVCSVLKDCIAKLSRRRT
jgi:dTDP-4-amino-4,6-dideoxygalactose transaminase